MPLAISLTYRCIAPFTPFFIHRVIVHTTEQNVKKSMEGK